MILASFGCREGTITGLIDRWVKSSYEVVPDNTYREVWDQLFTIYADHYFRIKEANHSLFEIRNKLGKYR